MNWRIINPNDDSTWPKPGQMIEFWYGRGSGGLIPAWAYGRFAYGIKNSKKFYNETNYGPKLISVDVVYAWKYIEMPEWLKE